MQNISVDVNLFQSMINVINAAIHPRIPLDELDKVREGIKQAIDSHNAQKPEPEATPEQKPE